MQSRVSQTRDPRRLVLLAALLSISGLPTACASDSSGGFSGPAAENGGAQNGSEGPVLDETRFQSTVARSALRERAISELLRLAADRNAQVRANALEGLAPASARLAEPLAAGLKDENEGVRAIAAVVAGREGISEVSASVKGLMADPSPFARASAIYAMRALDSDTDPTPLGALLLEHPEVGVRAHAAFLLGELGEKSALPMLRQALHSTPPSASTQEVKLLGLQIAEAMVKLGDTSRLEGIRAALYPAHPDELEMAALAVQILGRLGDRNSIGALINLAEYRQRDRGMPAELRLAIAEAVGRMGRREGWFIAEEYVDDEDPLRRSLAAHVFGQTRRPRDMAQLEGLMDDPNPLVQVAAAAAVLEATRPVGRREARSLETP